VFGLAPFGVSMNDALAVGMLHHAVQILAAVLPAFVFWAMDRWRRRGEATETTETTLVATPAPED
jgi:hypothetical protein